MNCFRKVILVDHPYLAFPVSPDGEKTHAFASLWENDTMLYEFFLDLDFENPRFWTCCDMRRYDGRELILKVEDEHITQEQFNQLNCCKTFPGEAQLYQEPGRPQLHFSPARGYISDPNGLFYYDGLYHIFFQHDIFNLGWVDWKDHVNFAWGHAVSRDLIHWEETPDVLIPDERGPVFSGSGLVDLENVSGLGNGSHPPILLYYTAAGGQGRRSRHRQHEQCLAYSVDGGKTFRKYEKNPLIPFKSIGNRDPKVFFHPELKLWMLLVYTDDGEKYLLYTSRNLLDFEFVTEIKWDNMECPDLLYLPVNGNPEQRRMVLWGANGSYMTVEFDGEQFQPLSSVKKLQSDLLYSCAQTFHNAPNGRCIQMAVYRMGAGSAFNGCLTVPCDLSLRQEDGDYFLWAEPVPELEQLRTHTTVYRELTVENCIELPGAALMDVEIRMILQDGELSINGMPIRLDATRRVLKVGSAEAPLPYSDELRLRVLVDTVCVQLWEPNNRVFLDFGYSDFQAAVLRFETTGLSIDELKIHELKSIWEPGWKEK